MNLLFRTDASLDIGTGHVMRCLTLADAMRERGASSRFVCREHDGHLAEPIRARGHEIKLLPQRSGGNGNSHLVHAAWLGVSQDEDAEATLAVAREARPDWLVVDHYGVDATWERRLHPAAGRIMVIDDLCDRRHDCDLLLDQNLGRTVEDYAPLLRSGALILAGARYALLRAEFVQWRQPSLMRRRTQQLRDILVNLGGVDKQDATSVALETILRCDLPPEVRLTVIMGENAPWFEKVVRLANALPRPTRVLKGTSEVARLMAGADLAIGAAGSTSWERCALGLPTILIVLADNQRDIASKLTCAGAALSVGDIEAADCADRLMDAIEAFARQPNLMAAMASNASSLVDGAGVARVIDALASFENGR